MPTSGDLSALMAEQGLAQSQSGKAPSSSAPGQPSTPPREVGTITEEAQRMVTDVAEGIGNIPQEMIQGVLDMLGLARPPKNPEEQAKLQQFFQNYQRLDAEQQQAFQMRMQQEAQRKEMIRQEEEAKAAQREQAEAQGMSVPGGKVPGQGALDAMNQQRKGMGGASG